MIDDTGHVWLIEVNTNPCLETSCSLLSRIIPNMLDNAFRIALDSLFPVSKKSNNTTNLPINRFELIYNSIVDTKISVPLELVSEDEEDEEVFSDDEQTPA